MQELTPQDVLQVLDTYDFDFTILEFNESTATSEQAAEAIGCQVAQIAKSICFMIKNGDPVLVVASGVNTVDDRKMADLLNVGRKRVRMAKPDQCIEVFGYPPGGVPPIAHRTPGLAIYLDESLRQYERIYAAAGSSNINFGMTCEQLELMTNGIWADVAKA